MMPANDGCASTALGDAGASIRPVRDDMVSEHNAERLSDTLTRQAHQLIDLAAKLRSCSSAPNFELFDLPDNASQSRSMFFPDVRASEPDTRELARSTYRARRLRESIFKDPDLFGEPAWDILLDLANAAFAGERVSVSSACLGATVPSTTGLRWLSILEGKGLVEREDDLLDGRRTYVRLTRKGLSRMDNYLRASAAL